MTGRGRESRTGVMRPLARACVLRCPRCGYRPVLASYWRLHERCGGCGWLFKRQVGFELGVYTLNFIATIVTCLAAILVAFLATRPDPSIPALMIAGGAACVLVPVVFYPLANTLWAAVELAMRPLDPDEEADALTWLAVQRRDAPE
jgi:uncharacterized protein (DUF983 family)